MLELHICGGTGATDVILFGCWDTEVMQRVRAVAQTGTAVRVSKALIEAHTEMSAKFTTSRLPLFIRAVSDTNVESISDDFEDK